MNIPYYSDIDLNGNKIFNIGEPLNNNDAVNKLYIDNSINNLNININNKIQIEIEACKTYTDNQILIINNRINNIDNNLPNTVENIIANYTINNLSSNSSTNPLSANMGRQLNDVITNLSDRVYLDEDSLNIITNNVSNIDNRVTSLEGQVDLFGSRVININGEIIE